MKRFEQWGEDSVKGGAEFEASKRGDSSTPFAKIEKRKTVYVLFSRVQFT